jgi:hypothetical protein
MRYAHLRYFHPSNNVGASNLGGVTIAYTDEGWTYAICRENENFCRKTGRQVCKDKFAVEEFYPRKEMQLDDMIERVYQHIEKAPWFNKVVNYLDLPYHARLKHYLF